MRIKLVTFAPHPNFGTCLQSYALNKVLTDMGQDVEFIYNGREHKPIGIKGYIKKVIKRLLPSKVRNVIKKNRKQQGIVSGVLTEKPPYILELPNNYLKYFLSKLPGFSTVYKKYKCENLQWQKVYRFTFEDGNFNMKRLYIKRQYAEVVDDADVFVTGSDQIWNPYCGGFNPMMFLEFAGEKKRIAYSSSISRPFLPKEVEERIRIDLGKFQHIAVREQKSVEILRKLLKRDDVQLVVDPTYLLTKEEWATFGQRANFEFKIPSKYIFCYFIGSRKDDYNQMVENVKRQIGIQDVIIIDCVGSDMTYGNGFIYKDGGPYEFVYLLSHASYVCTDSFHATIFSLKFQKECAHILKSDDDGDVNSQNTRMFDILKRYGLLYKLYKNDSLEWMREIDYSVVNEIIDEEIKNSMAYLKNAINN